MTDLTPDDVATALQAKFAATEGEPPSSEVTHEMCVKLAEWTVAVGVASGDTEAEVVAAVKLLAETAAMIPGYDTEGCDGCCGTFDTEVMEAADSIVPPSAHASADSDDPTIGICGFCIYEDRHTDPPYPDPRDEMFEMARQDLEEAQGDADAEQVTRALGWSA